MRRCLFLISAILLIPVFAATSSADLLDRCRHVSDTRYICDEPVPGLNQEDIAGSTPIEFSLDVGRSGGCGFDTLAGLKQAFSLEAGKRYLKDLASSTLTAAPLVFLCYTSQTLCDAYKFFKSSANAMLALRQQSCERIQSAAMSLGASMRSGAQASCLDSELKAGKDIEAAYQECVEGKSGFGKQFKRFYSTDNILNRLPYTTTQKTAVKTLIGVDASVQGNYGRVKVDPYAFEKQVESNRQERADTAKQIIDKVSSGGTVTKSDIDKLSTKTKYIPKSTIKLIASLPPDYQEWWVKRYSEYAGIEDTLGQVQDVMSVLEADSNDPNITQSQREDIEKRKEALKDKYWILKERLEMSRAGLEDMEGTLEKAERDMIKKYPEGSEIAP